MNVIARRNDVAICFNLAEMLINFWTFRPFNIGLLFLPSPQAGGAFPFSIDEKETKNLPRTKKN